MTTTPRGCNMCGEQAEHPGINSQEQLCPCPCHPAYTPTQMATILRDLVSEWFECCGDIHIPLLQAAELLDPPPWRRSAAPVDLLEDPQ